MRQQTHIWILAAITVGVHFAGFAGPRPVAAQVVRGRVVDGATQTPVPGAFITLVYASGNRQGGALSGTDGTFVLRAPEAGRYALHAERIAYQTAVSDTLEPAAGRCWRIASKSPSGRFTSRDSR